MGDLYLARSIRYELQKNKLRCNISLGENNERRFSSREDLALNLRGIESVKQLNKQNFINCLLAIPNLLILLSWSSLIILQYQAEYLQKKSKI